MAALGPRVQLARQRSRRTSTSVPAAACSVAEARIAPGRGSLSASPARLQVMQTYTTGAVAAAAPFVCNVSGEVDMLHPSTAFLRKVSTKSPRVTCRRPPARARTKDLRPLDHPPAHPGRCLSRRLRTDGRSPGSRIGASSCLPGGTLPPVAHADETSRSQLRGQLRIWPTLVVWPHRIPFSPSNEGPSVGQ